jgi:two-component system, response regulator
MSKPVDVVVAAESPADVELTLRALEAAVPGTGVAVAHDGEEVLELLLHRAASAGGPAPRLLLLDRRLSKLDGFEVLQLLKADPRTRTTPVVVVLDGHDERTVRRAYQLGANSCIVKPVDFGAFRTRIGEVGRYWLAVSEPPEPADAVRREGATTGA